ncbi:hypothetical protein Clacol_004271 [Clathrus columnatus]|uniref:Transmembrane protein n=1 Tax=Clathrus columnatus TaxID=1419009 RepID=A0AAV5ADP7_9AGAM|nr:hypothetical protein Clacol_004271 [Clathrus columnatus]
MEQGFSLAKLDENLRKEADGDAVNSGYAALHAVHISVPSRALKDHHMIWIHPYYAIFYEAISVYALSRKAEEVSSAVAAEMGVYDAADKAACAGFEAQPQTSLVTRAVSRTRAIPDRRSCLSSDGLDITFAQSITTKLNAPFSQFLNTEDLPEFDPMVQNETPGWKRKVLRLLSIIQAISWGTLAIWTIFQGVPSVDILFLSLSALLSSMILYKSPLRKASVLIMFYMALNTISAVVDFIDGSTNARLNAFVLAIDALRIITNGCLTWLIPSNGLCSPEDGVSLWEWVTFSFVEPILDLAVQRAWALKIKETSKHSTPSPSEAFISGAITPASTIVASNDQSLLDPHLATTKQLSSLEVDGNEILDNQFGPRRTLAEEDVWSLPPSFLHRNVFHKHLLDRSE